jgi:hypothetical protein
VSGAAASLSALKAAPSTVKVAPGAAAKGAVTALPDRIGAFHTFGRKKVGASLLARVKARQGEAPKKGGKSRVQSVQLHGASISQSGSKPGLTLMSVPKALPSPRADVVTPRADVVTPRADVVVKKTSQRFPSVPSTPSQTTGTNSKSIQRFIYLMKENQTAHHSPHSSPQPSKGWGMRDVAPPALQAAWDAHDGALPKCQHKKCNNRALYGLWKGRKFVETSCERHRTRAGLQRSRPHCSATGCSNVAVMGLFSSGQFCPSKCYHHASPDMVDARGSSDVAFGSPSSAPPSIWQNFQAHPKHQQEQEQADEERRAESWHEDEEDALGSNGGQFDGAGDLQNSILWASIKKSGFCFLDVLCNDDTSMQSKDPSVIALRAQARAISDSDAGRALSQLCASVVEQLREMQSDAAHESVAGCHYLTQHPHASAYFRGEFALAKGQLHSAVENFNLALAGPLPQVLIVFSRIGLAAALRGLRHEVESTNQLRSVLKIFPHNCDLLLACAQHVLALGRSKDEAEALLQYAINAHPRSISALLAMSRFQLAYRNSHFVSISYAKKALEIDPEHSDSLLQRAVAHAAAPHSSFHDTRLYFRRAAASQVQTLTSALASATGSC